MSQYNFALFEELQQVTTQVAMRAGELVFQVVNGVLTIEDLRFMVNNAHDASNADEAVALLLVSLSVDRMGKRIGKT